MKGNDFTINVIVVWILVTGSLLLSILGGLAKIYSWGFFPFYATGAVMLLFASWVIIFSDMVRNKIYNKPFWLLTMFTLPHLAVLFYVLQREKLIRLGSKLTQTA